jgi:hypothetical protein
MVTSMGMDYWTWVTVKATKEIGGKGRSGGKALIFIKMGIDMKESLKMENEKGRAHSNGRMGLDI